MEIPRTRTSSVLSPRLWLALLLCAAPLVSRADSVVVFNEIMYHPATNEVALEWIELHNQNAVDVDLSGWSLSDGIGYLFPDGTVIKGGAYLVVAIAPATLMAHTGITNVMGPFTGRLSNGGEAVKLRDNTRRLMDEVVYGTSGAWPREPDGTGPSLAKRHPNLASRPAEDWASSQPIGGTPGAPNLPFSAVSDEAQTGSPDPRPGDIVINEIMYHAPPRDPRPAVTSTVTLVPITGTWRYEDTGRDLGTAWRAPGYDDRAWPAGTGLLAVNTGILPAPTGTTLAANRPTYYFRRSFNFRGATTNVTFEVRSLIDDGAVFYLNGEEIHRENLPPGPMAYTTAALAAIVDASYGDPLQIPANRLVQGLNVLAVEVHQSGTVTAPSTGIVLSGGGLALVEEGPFGGIPPMNLAREPGAAPFAIDSLAGYSIHNHTGLTDGLYGNSNSWIGNTGSPGYAGVRFGGLFRIGGIAFGRDNLGTYTDRTFGTYTLQYTRVESPGAGTASTENPDTGWATIGTLDYQSAGTGLFTAPSRRHRFALTPVDATAIRLLVPGTGMGPGTCIDELEVNPPDTSGDIAFGAELALTTTLAPAAVYAESDEEWIELLNPSTNAVDLTGWRLEGGIAFHFTNGPVLAPEGYLVVARDTAALRANWPERAASIIGEFSGRLRENEWLLLRDGAGDLIDEARVLEGGWSDGGGSSLELRDPRADNRQRDAWADSDESAKSTWQTVRYRLSAGQSYGSTRWNEFRIGLLDEGIVLLDDISVVRDPEGVREELIQNGQFETTAGNTHWRCLGNHRGEFVADPDNGANHVLRLTAADRAVMNHNHVETTFRLNTGIVDGQLYEASYRARWVAGSPQVNTRAYFSKLARTTLLAMPRRLGTPAAPNSRRIVNLGPTFSGLQHAPVVPAPNQAVSISVRASDPDGIASATVSYRANPTATFRTQPMTLQSTGVWTASLPGQSAGKIVQFYITARDTLGASATAPAKGPDSRALYQVADTQGTTLPTHELRLIMLDADRDFMLQPTNVMSNARNGATLIYDRTEVFYDAGARLQGTAASRIRDGDDYVCYDIALPPGHLFRGVQDNIGIDRSGRTPTPRGQDEMYVLQMFHRAGLAVPYHDLCYFIAPRTAHTGTAILQLAGYGKGFVDEQYDREGSVFNMDITYEPDITVDGGVESAKLPVPHQGHIGTDFTDLGDQEQYRSPFDIRSGNRRDDYAGLMRLCQVMALPQPSFDAQIADVLDVDRALRMVALEILCGIGDTYISSSPSLPHNLRLITFPDGTPAQLLPWDMDFTFAAGTSSSIFLHPGINLAKLLSAPATRRLYLQHINDLCQAVFTTNYLNSWLAHYGRVVGQNFSAASSYVASRRAFALTQLPARVAFTITSNSGQDFATPTNRVTLSGAGWVDVRTIRVNGLIYPANWTTLTNWSITVPLEAGSNVLTVEAVDRSGGLLANGTDTITVTNTAPQPPRIEEVNLDSHDLVFLRFSTSPGHLYAVQYADDADGPQWLPLIALRAPADSLTVTDTNGLASERRFYRVVLVE